MGCEPLPNVGISKVIGLLELVHDEGDEVETARVALDLDLEFDALLPVLEAAKTLGFVEIKSGKIRLTRDGKKLVASGIAARRKFLRKRLAGVRLFKDVFALLQKRKRVKRRSLVKYCRLKLPKSEAEKTVDTIVNWGRNAEAIGYDSGKQELYAL